MIRVFTPNKEIIGNLIAYSELSKETGISETATLRFRAPLESAHLLKYEGLVQYKRGKEWIIKELVKDPEWLEVICKEYHPGLDAWIENQAWITQTAKLMLTELLDGTGVVLDMPDYTEKRTVTGGNLSKKELMFKVIDAFGLESTITDSNTLVVRKTLGEDRGAYATDELNLQSLVTAGDTYDFATRIEPRGRDGMTIAEVNGGLTYLDDNSYSDRAITVYWEDNRYTDKMSLKADALKKLEVLAKPLISYKALILDLARGDESSLFFYALGDSMTLLSSQTNERIQQRIVAIKEYLEEPWRNVATLANRPRTLVNQEVEDLKANYEWVKTSIEQLDDELKLKVSSEEYDRDKESNESRFTSMSSEITQNREGITARVTKEEILTDPDIQAELKGKDADQWTIGVDGFWYKNGVKTSNRAIPIDGSDGDNWEIGADGFWYKNGVKTNKYSKGDKGADGQSQYTHIRYSPNADGYPMSTNPWPDTKYIGIAVTTYSIAPSGYASYSWAKFAGEDGEDGQDGIPGVPGEDGKPVYTWIKYADTPTSGMSNLPAGKDYIGIASNKKTETPSNNYSDYLWSLIRGPKGADGNDGNSNFTWIKYADDDKGTGMSDSPEGKRWLGVAANKDTSLESNDWRDYTWSPLYDNSVIMSATAPSSPNLAQLWLDTSAKPNLLKRWTGSEWEIISDVSELEELVASKASQSDLDSQIANVVSSIQASLDSEITQTNDTFNIKFSETIDAINAAGDRISALSSEIETNIRFTADGIELGKSTNPVSVKILPDRVSFSEGGQEVAYFSNNKLYVTDIHVLTSLRIGDFAFFPRASGNLSFRKVT